MAYLRLSPAHLEIIRRESEAAYPAECCGLLVGAGNKENGIDVHHVVTSRNLAATDRNDRFEVDPETRFHAMREAEEQELEIVGHYHSHPDHLAEPSSTDLEMAFEPDLMWVIASVSNGRLSAIKAFQLSSDGTRFEPLEAHPGTANSFDLVTA